MKKHLRRGKRQAAEMRESFNELVKTLDGIHEQLERLHQTASVSRDYATASAAMSMMLDIDDAPIAVRGGKHANR